MNLRNLVLAAVLAISPLTGVLAQSTGPGIKADSMKESSAVDNGSAPNAQPGATGSSMVTGNKSTVASDNKATTDTKTGGVAGGK